MRWILGVLNVGIVLLIISGNGICRRKRNGSSKIKTRKKWVQAMLWPLADSIAYRLLYHKRAKTSFMDRQKARLRQVHIATASYIENMVVEYYTDIIASILGVLLIVNMVCAITIGWQYGNSLIHRQDQQTAFIELERNVYGEGSTEYPLQVSKEDLNTEITLVVDEVKYSQQQLEEEYIRAEEYIEEQLLQGNLSYDNIQTDLNLIQTIPVNDIQVKWSSSDYEVIDSKGHVQNEALKEETIITLIACLTYEEKEKEVIYTLNVLPKEYTEQEKQIKTVVAVLDAELQQQASNIGVKIPENIDGVKIQLNTNDSFPEAILCFGFIICILIGWRRREQINGQIKKRNEALLREYPNIINRLVLLLGAGMTVKGAFTRMVKDYYQQRKEGQANHSYIYEEMQVMLNGMDAGISELQAYYDLGRKLRLSPYLKLTSLLIQNVTKGAKGILGLLQQEEVMAFEIRKELAKRQGEQAGTKLLLPMVLLMAIVMVIVMCPAIFSFAI